mgnify:CR=1 FL=1
MLGCLGIARSVIRRDDAGFRRVPCARASGRVRVPTRGKTVQRAGRETDGLLYESFGLGAAKLKSAGSRGAQYTKPNTKRHRMPIIKMKKNVIYGCPIWLVDFSNKTLKF